LQGSPRGEALDVLWLEMPEGWRPGLYVLASVHSASQIQGAERAPVQLYLAADQSIELRYGNHSMRSCHWRLSEARVDG
jgi:hypothetical protein